MGSPTQPMPTGSAVVLASARASSFEALRDRLRPKWSFQAKYLLGGMVMEGTFGTVYLALQEQEHARQHVAFKILKPNRLTLNNIASLQEEARFLGSLHHRILPRAVDLVHFEDQWALVTEWLPGFPLSSVLSAPTPLGVALEIIAELASGLRALRHRPKSYGGAVVHCDIKPENIRISPYGCVHLLDFGSAQDD